MGEPDGGFAPCSGFVGLSFFDVRGVVIWGAMLLLVVFAGNV